MSKPVSPAEPNLSQQLQIDSCCLQFEQQWRSGAAPQIEEFLSEAEESVRPHLLAELVQIEWELLQEQGTQPDVAAYRARFGEFSAEINSAAAEFSATEVMPRQSGDQATDYQIVSQLGTQASGVSYRAIRPGDGAEIDVLVLNGLDPDAAERVKRRVRLASQLNHPAATRVLTSDLEHEESAVVLETTSQRSLYEAVSKAEQTDEQQFLSLGCQLASVLAAGHRLGLAHGCLTPQSVFLRPDGTAQVDFVRPAPGEDTSMDQKEDTQFLAPEATDIPEPDAAGDVFSLNSMLVWMFTGEAGEPLAHVDDFRRRLQQWLPQSEGTTSALNALCDVVTRALQSDPADRATAQEVLEQLEVVAQHAGVPWSGADATIGHAAPVSDATNVEQTVLYDDSDIVQKLGSSAIGNRKRLGRYQISDKLGEGGMGAVYRATDSADGSTVAVKVLSERMVEHPEALRRFRKEARLLGEITSPYVTNLLEINEDAGVHFIVMEYVHGTDLRLLIKQKAPFDERTALSLVADTARGLVGAHERGIVHRDIKPANILLARDGSATSGHDDDTTVVFASPETQSSSTDVELPWHVKLSDFGLARHVDQSESMKLTQSGMFVGTPTYMSPEQFADHGEITPAADVYALGVTLFELLTGKPPFAADELVKLINLHGQAPPPQIQKINAAVSDAAVEIVGRSLAKKPADRYADAAQMLREIERVLRGEASDIAAHPHVPPHDESEVISDTFEWQLQGAAADLWPYVSNTERINCAVGIPSVVYETKRDAQGRLRKYGAFRMAGQNIAWEEHPFEWVEGQRLGILREFHQGPFYWFLSIVELIPQAGGGTLLRHSVRIKPRGLLGRLVATLEVRVKGKRALDRVYGRIDRSVSGRLGSGPTIDPYTTAAKLPGARKRLLDERLDRLSQSVSDPRIAESLGSYLGEAPAQELGRIRPLGLAAAFDLDGDQFLEGCLQAAKEGLLDLHWDILCPTCRISSTVAQSLQEVKNHSRCEVCDLDFDVDLVNSVELIFRAHAEIREVDVATYCIGGPEHSPHVVLQVRMAPGERVELTPLLTEGRYLLRSAQLTTNYELRVLPAKGTTHTEFVLSPDQGPRGVSQLRAGRNLLAVTNDYDREIVIRLERSIPMTGVVTAAQATALPAFRELFPHEVLKSGELITVSTVTLLGMDIADADRVFEELGDAEAFAALQRFRDRLSEHAGKHAGSIIKVAGTEILCTFETPGDALNAVAAMAREMGSGDTSGGSMDVQWRAGMHRGTALATSSSGELDYFGRTVHLTQRLTRLAGGGELLLTETVAADPQIVAWLQDQSCPVEVCDFPLAGEWGRRGRRIPLQTPARA